MNPSMERGEEGSSTWSKSPYWGERVRISREWRSRELEELMPDLPRDEQLRLQNQLRERDRIRRQWHRMFPPLSPSSSNPHFGSARSERQRESVMVPFVLDALRHYNARHPGGEFDPVKPLMYSRVHFRGHDWFHINFWACSRFNSKIIKRFFAEIHRKPFPTSPNDYNLDPNKITDYLPIVETCMIIEEPLSQYKRSCGFCVASLDILHPKGCRKFVCGNDKDRTYQRLEQPRGCCGIRREGS